MFSGCTHTGTGGGEVVKVSNKECGGKPADVMGGGSGGGRGSRVVSDGGGCGLWGIVGAGGEGFDVTGI